MSAQAKRAARAALAVGLALACVVLAGPAWQALQQGAWTVRAAASAPSAAGESPHAAEGAGNASEAGQGTADAADVAVPVDATASGSFAEGDAAAAAFAWAGGYRLQDARPVSDGFARAVFDPVQLGAQCACQDGLVVGAEVPLPRAQAEQKVAEALRAHGWERVVSGPAASQGEAYVCAGGPYRWVHVLCQEAAGATCVVAVVQPADEGSGT